MNIQAQGGFKYFIMFTDDHSRYGYIYLMHHTCEAFEKFRKFKYETEKQLGKTIKVLQSNLGGKYVSREFFIFSQIKGF